MINVLLSSKPAVLLVRSLLMSDLPVVNKARLGRPWQIWSELPKKPTGLWDVHRGEGVEFDPGDLGKSMGAIDNAELTPEIRLEAYGAAGGTVIREQIDEWLANGFRVGFVDFDDELVYDKITFKVVDRDVQ